MLHHDHGIVVGPETMENLHQAVAVARMQTDGWLVEHIERIDQRGADGGSKIDAFQLSPG